MHCVGLSQRQILFLFNVRWSLKIVVNLGRVTQWFFWAIIRCLFGCQKYPIAKWDSTLRFQMWIEWKGWAKKGSGKLSIFSIMFMKLILESFDSKLNQVWLSFKGQCFEMSSAYQGYRESSICLIVIERSKRRRATNNI